MASAVESLVSQALELTESERSYVIDRLLTSLDAPDPATEAIWTQEADARVEAYEKGEVEAVPARSVFAKYRQK